MHTKTKAILVAALAVSLSACGGVGDDSLNDSGSGSGSGSSSSNSIGGIWLSSDGTQSWTFQSSSTGYYQTRSVDGGTCDTIFITYSFDQSSGNLTYTGVSEKFSGAYPVPDTANPSQKAYTTSVSVNGSTATIEGATFVKAEKEACNGIAGADTP